MPIAPVNDVELNYRLEGDGDETIVLVNGLADDLETWAYQADDFIANGFRVLRFDNRGIGASSKPAGPYSSRMFADDAKDATQVDQLGPVQMEGVNGRPAGGGAPDIHIAIGRDERLI